MGARDPSVPALLTAAAFFLLPVSAPGAEAPAARPLLNAWEIHDEVKPAPGADRGLQRRLLPFRDYQDLVLFHPAFGYYSSGRVQFGPDFQTYPIALAPYFGQMIAEQIFRMWQGMRQAGSLEPHDRFTIAEFGAGDGVLAESVLDYLERRAGEQPPSASWRDFASQTVYVCYDRSPALSKAQRTRNARFGPRFEAREADATDPAAAIPPESLKGVILSNELPDAFSVHKVILSADGFAEAAFVVPSLPGKDWARIGKIVPGEVAEEVAQGDSKVRMALGVSKRESIYLGRESFAALLRALVSSPDYEPLVQSLQFQEVYLPVSAIPELAGHLRRYAGAYARELAKLDKGVVTYINLGAEQYIRGAGRILKVGYVVTLDYGSNWEGWMGQNAFAHLRTYGPAHREAIWNAGLEGDSGQAVAEFETSDPYRGPTLNDMTTDVNFSLLAAEGDLAELRTLFYGPQSALRTGTPVSLPGSNDWSQTFETNSYYKLLVQQKRGTDASYSFPESRQEPLIPSESGLDGQRRGKAQEIEKILGAAPGPPLSGAPVHTIGMASGALRAHGIFTGNANASVALASVTTSRAARGAAEPFRVSGGAPGRSERCVKPAGCRTSPGVGIGVFRLLLRRDDAVSPHRCDSPRAERSE